MTQTAPEVDYGFNQQELEVAQKELKLALFTDYSSMAYSRGKLKHAADARSKARSLCMKATARLTVSARSNDELAWYLKKDHSTTWKTRCGPHVDEPHRAKRSAYLLKERMGCRMRIRIGTLTLCLVVLVIGLSGAYGAAKEREKTEIAAPGIGVNVPIMLWRSATDIAARNLFYGPGGKEHQPHSTFSFIKEDLDGTSPKIVVRDQDGVKWKVKLGAEARPETAASRLVWAVGYFANEDYFLPDLLVSDIPAHLHRGQKLVAPDGSMHNVRLKRYIKGEEKIGNWKWSDNPLSGTRELNGLRVMMALINNWDLTDQNNAIYEENQDGGGTAERIYMVSDLGSSFGTAGLTWPLRKARGNLDSYSHSKFIIRATSDHVDFNAPDRDALFFLVTPREFLNRLRICWIGKQVLRADAKWMGQLLGQLSPEQIRDAFRAAGYSPQEVEGFTRVVEERIGQLEKL
jgi:hypothetical protein